MTAMMLYPRLLLLLIGMVPAAVSADWLNAAGDLQRSNSQAEERALTPATVKGIKLLWQRPLGEKSATLPAAPVVNGRLITYRGSVELVFTATSAGDIYAVDGDSGKVFWKRHVDVAATPAPRCSAGGTPLLALAENPPPKPGEPADDDGPQPLRPLYVLFTDHRLHTLNPIDGASLTAPVALLPTTGAFDRILVAKGMLYASETPGCAPDPPSVVSLDVTHPGAKVSRHPMSASSALLPPAAIAFRWRERSLQVGRTAEGRIGILPALPAAANNRQAAVAADVQIATWPDANGLHWVFAASGDQLHAFQVRDRAGAPELVPRWHRRILFGASAIVAGGGVLYALSTDANGRSVLHALDAAAGEPLYNSASTLPEGTAANSLSLANGHVCLAAANQTLYCFGIPEEQ